MHTKSKSATDCVPWKAVTHTLALAIQSVIQLRTNTTLCGRC